MKRAAITGITGQDGIFLTEILLKKKYKVIGFTTNQKSERAKQFQKLYPGVNLIEYSLNELDMIRDVLRDYRPTEFYNLAALSSVYASNNYPELTYETNTNFPIRLIEILYQLKIQNQTRFYQASSSEMFGNSNEIYQNEETRIEPISEYGKSKSIAHNYCLEQRKNGLFITCGILFNHESEFRGENFVSKKICKGIAEITMGKSDKLTIGNILPSRDWGYARDYASAIWKMTNYDYPTDFVIATGVSRSIKNFIETALYVAGLDIDVARFINQDIDLFRPEDIIYSRGDASKAKILLDWKPQTSFEDMISKIYKWELKKLTVNKPYSF